MLLLTPMKGSYLEIKSLSKCTVVSMGNSSYKFRTQVFLSVAIAFSSSSVWLCMNVIYLCKYQMPTVQGLCLNKMGTVTLFILWSFMEKKCQTYSRIFWVVNWDSNIFCGHFLKTLTLLLYSLQIIHIICKILQIEVQNCNLKEQTLAAWNKTHEQFSIQRWHQHSGLLVCSPVQIPQQQ